MAEINKYNFLRWDSNPAVSDPTDLPKGYIFERDRYLAMPVLVPGEALNFYINKATGVAYTNFTELKLDVIQNSTIISTNIAPLLKDVIDVTNYNIYSRVTVPALADGIYQLVIRRASTVLLTSNYVRVMNAGYGNSTSLFRFTNDIDLYAVRYSQLTNFFQQFRLSITKIGTEYEQNRQQYQSVTTGVRRNLLAVDQEFIKMETYFFDEEAHRATACMLGHSDIYINDKFYTFKTGYKFEPIVSSLLTKGNFELWDPSFVEINKCD